MHRFKNNNYYYLSTCYERPEVSNTRKLNVYDNLIAFVSLKFMTKFDPIKIFD